ncbi:MAG: hypothetical protein JXC31_06170 [Acholeplasmataceae bacterium]|nr:hypothetical protein [Acholeplasmataceae bacterium]
MPKKIIIETDELEDEIERELHDDIEQKIHGVFRNVHRHTPRGYDRPERIIKKKYFMDIENEVKLFTDKTEMVTYVNQLSNIHNVEIFKIEDQLYKVLVTRKKEQDDSETDEE